MVGHNRSCLPRATSAGGLSLNLLIGADTSSDVHNDKTLQVQDKNLTGPHLLYSNDSRINLCNNNNNNTNDTSVCSKPKNNSSSAAMV